jgi:putative ABC transport system substrate-binding protein
MRRRDFVAAVFATVVVMPVAAAGRPRVGVLDINSAEAETQNMAAFRDGLQRLGYIESRTVDIDYRFSNGSTEALTALARELLQLKPDVILASAVSPTRVVHSLAPAMPIVCTSFSDSFVPSLAESFAHPGGSVTGIATDVDQLIGKLVELALDAIPGTTKVGFLANPAGGSMARFEQQVLSTAGSHHIAVQVAEAAKVDDIDNALQELKAANVQSVIVPANGLFSTFRSRIVKNANALQLPAVFALREGTLAGGLASYGVNQEENYRLAASYVTKIFKGAAPGDLPIEFPTKIELLLNLKAAKALGITLPRPLLDRADEVIE